MNKVQYVGNKSLKRSWEFDPGDLIVLQSADNKIVEENFKGHIFMICSFQTIFCLIDLETGVAFSATPEKSSGWYYQVSSVTIEKA